jgi:hypothetical protein
MRKKVVEGNSLWVVAFIIFSLSCGPVWAAEPISTGMDLPQLALQPPESEEAMQYLGLKSSDPFPLSEIPAKLYLMEVFYILCMDCQKTAPNINKLFSFVQKDAELSENAKMFGVGIRGDHKKLGVYSKQFRVKFPLLPDPENETYEKLGEPKIPFLMVVSSNGKVLLTHSGPIKDVGEFFSEIKKIYKEQ